MPNTWMRFMTGAATVACALLLVMIFFGRDIATWSIDPSKLQNFKIIFLSIILEALPFLLIGVIISALLQSFVSDKLIQKLTPPAIRSQECCSAACWASSSRCVSAG